MFSIAEPSSYDRRKCYLKTAARPVRRIDGFRWAILGGEARLYWPGFLLSWGVIAGFLWLGIRQFRRLEKSFADLI
ncbi:MAG: hypothetical protein WBJ41_01620 [Chromatiaceae bacterium]